MTKDERELFNEKIKGLSQLINAQFMNVQDKLEQIHTEAKRTNSRVTHLEEYKEYANTIIANRVKPEQLKELVGECHTKIESINTKMEDLNFILKHPKLFIAGLVFIVTLTLATFLNNNPMKAFEHPQPTQTEQTK